MLRFYFNFYLITFSLFVALLSVPFLAFAQQNDTDTLRHETETVIIQSTRTSQLKNATPSSISLIEKNEIQQVQATLSIEESLRKVPGLFVNNRFNFSQGERISIRGMGSRAQFGVRNIKVLLDGIPLTFADGQTQLNNLDLSYVGRIEVLRGPSSFIYGNAAAGVIYMTSEKPDSNILTITPRVTFGSYGLQKYQAKFSGSSGKFSYLLNTSRTDFEGFREFSSARFYNINSNTNYHINDSSRLALVVHLMDAPYLFNPNTLTKAEAETTPNEVRQLVKRQGSGKEVRQGQVGLNYVADYKNNQRVDASIFGIKRGLYNPIFGRVIDVDRNAAGLRSLYEKKFFIGKNTILAWSAGLDAEYQEDAREERQNLGLTDAQLQRIPRPDLMDSVKKGNVLVRQTERIMGSGAFIQLRLSLLQNLTLSAAGRYDYFIFDAANKLSDTGSGNVHMKQFSPSVGLVYQLFSSTQLFSNFSTAFQTPTANEFSNVPGGGGGFNASLRPERTRSIEAGSRFKTKRFSAEVSAFYFTVSNQIIPYQTGTTGDEVFYRNAGKTSNTGIEALLKIELLKGLQLSANYTFMNFIFTDYLLQQNNELIQLNGNKVPGVPTHRLFSGLIYTHEKSGLSAEVNVQYVGSYFANDMNGGLPWSNFMPSHFINDAYVLTDLRFGYFLKTKPGRTFAGLQLFGGINNVFNVKYNASILPNAAANRFFEPGMGRNFYAGLEVPVRFGKKG